MTIDEIKQALREMKEICDNNLKCSNCPFAVGKTKHCPAVSPYGVAVPPCNWYLNWPEDDHTDKANVTDPLTMNGYQRMARRTAGTKQNYEKMEEALFGLAGKVGELCDHYKKFMHQGHDIDYDHMAEEAGDVLWYLAEIADALDVTLEDIARRNIDKLLNRYPDGFDPERSINREEEHEEDDHG